MPGTLAFVTPFAFLVSWVLLAGLALLEGTAADLGTVLSSVLLGLSGLEDALLLSAVLLLTALACTEEVVFGAGGFFAFVLETAAFAACWLLPV
ncbi:hypothetical protein MHY01S_18150 [Meiothermus hypogaeus NBRC 106114]|uniref:Uncharacterized protein n=1 Tax=Meiothermus hypogaeus NBRC 106114 TaxID=1227553 RepID=A0A511R223_9DEIN|nr:hypothetical protein MHY01S_18150 [Meiothermus hypogaeus NBRC 106114]